MTDISGIINPRFARVQEIFERNFDAGDDLGKRRLEGRIAAMHDDIGIHIAPDILRRQMIERIGEGHATEVSGALHPASQRDFCSYMFRS